MSKFIGGMCPSCGTKKEYGLCPNKKCSVWTFGNNLDEYEEFFKKAIEHYSKTHIRIKGRRNYHSRISYCPTCNNTQPFEKEPTKCSNCEQLLDWSKL